jgi:hypothetical protein
LTLFEMLFGTTEKVPRCGITELIFILSKLLRN